MSRPSYPHEMLEGMALPGGWVVVRRISRHEGGTGGNFSCGYLVERSGQQGYLKALDFFSRLAEEPDPARALEPLVRAFNFERDLLAQCQDHRLSHIVIALGDGSVPIPGVQSPSPVQYIIFELAEGDVRDRMARADRFELAWVLRSLHQIAVGLSQIHSIGAVHQDVKPSNVLLFDSGRSSKLADLGCAAIKGVEGPRDGFIVPGDHAYAPPELLYGVTVGSWEMRRMACDVYHLGSMIAFLFTGVAMTPLLMMNLDDRFQASNWRGSYEEVLPFIRAAFLDAVEYVANEFPVKIHDELRTALLQLCDPDPRLRGHPRERDTALGNSFLMRRYVSQFDLLASKAELGLVRL